MTETAFPAVGKAEANAGWTGSTWNSCAPPTTPAGSSIILASTARSSRPARVPRGPVGHHRAARRQGADAFRRAGPSASRVEGPGRARRSQHRTPRLPHPPDADAQPYPAAGQLVQSRHALGQDHGVLSRQDEDTGRQAENLGPRRDEREQVERVRDVAVLRQVKSPRGIVGVPALVVGDDHWMLNHDDGLESAGLTPRQAARTPPRESPRPGPGSADRR